MRARAGLCEKWRAGMEKNPALLDFWRFKGAAKAVLKKWRGLWEKKRFALFSQFKGRQNLAKTTIHLLSKHMYGGGGGGGNGI